MAGTIPLSMTQQFDEYGKPLKGGQLYIMQVGTVSTPQDAFVDYGLTVKQPYPMTLDAAGRVPQFFVADGYVKVRLQDKDGVVQLASDAVLVVGPSSGSGGGGTTVDPTQLIQPGNMIFRHGVGALAGYVRLNGLTLGSATSGSTERANADTQVLFQQLWGADPTLAVSGGRGATSIADWTANKQLALPDWRGYALGALDDMGNAAAGRLSAAFFGSSPIVLGAVGGAESRILTGAQCALIAHQHDVFLKDPGHAHNYTGSSVYNGAYGASGGAPNSQNVLSTTINTTGMLIGSVAGVANDNKTAMNAAVAAAAHAAIGPRKLVTFYMKL